MEMPWFPMSDDPMKGATLESLKWTTLPLE